MRGRQIENLGLESKNTYLEKTSSFNRIFARGMELSVAFLLALAILSLLSFLSVRPMLNEVRGEAGVNWDKFVKAARERNELIPGLVESIKSTSPGQAKLAAKLFEERSVLHRSNDPKEIIASVDEMDRQLTRIERLARSSTEINSYLPFSQTWKKISTINSDMRSKRILYNQTARRHNDLMAPFPQNIFTSIFGFVPLQYYPLGHQTDES